MTCLRDAGIAGIEEDERKGRKLRLLSTNPFGIRIGMSPTGFWSDRLLRRLIFVV